MRPRLPSRPHYGYLKSTVLKSHCCQPPWAYASGFLVVRQQQNVLIHWWAMVIYHAGSSRFSKSNVTWNYGSEQKLHCGVVVHALWWLHCWMILLCREESRPHMFLKCNAVVKFWGWIFEKFNVTIVDETFLYLNNHEEMSELTWLV